MKGNAPFIIKLAIELNLLCRPCDGSCWTGEALSPEPDSFVRRSAGSTNYLGLWHPDPKHFLVDWELLTHQILAQELEGEIRFQANLFGGK